MFVPLKAQELAKRIPYEGFKWSEDGSAIVEICKLVATSLHTQGITVTADVLVGVLLTLADIFGWDAPNMGPGTEAVFYRFIAEHV